MKRAAMILAVTALGITGCEQPADPANGDVDLDTEDKRAAYAIGYRSGEQMHGQMDDLDTESFLAGMRDGMGGKTEDLPMETADMDDAIMEFQQKMMARQQETMEEEGKKNREEGDEYRAENAEREEVTELDSGLQYEVLESGDEDAKSPEPGDTIKAHYHGTLVDGTVFDSSRDRGEPATFPLSGVIPGWQEALPKMKVGDKWRIVLPPDLAYGEHGAGEMVGPNATLIFEVELLEVLDEEEAQQQMDMDPGMH